MKAPHAEQLALLDVQEHDTKLAQLQHRLNSLPQTQELADLRERLARLLVEASFRNGSHDNITAVVVGGISPPAAAAHLHHTN